MIGISHSQLYKKNISALNRYENIPLMNARTLLLPEERRKLFEKITTLLSFLGDDVETHYLPLINRFAEYVQHLPSTGSSYFSYLGGFLDFALDRTLLSTENYVNYLFPHQNYSALEKPHRLWIYVLFSAALLFEIGKLFIFADVELYDQQGKHLERWSPLEGSMLEVKGATQYRFKLVEHNDPDFMERGTLILAKGIMPPDSLQWIARSPEALSAWLALLVGDLHGVSSFVGIIPLANAEAIARYFEEKMKVEKKSYKQYREDTGQTTTTEDLMEEQDKEQAQEEHERILEDIDKKEEKAQRRSFADIFRRPFEGGRESSENAGIAFLKWIGKNIESGKMRINQRNSLVHNTNEGAFIKSEAFDKFVEDNKRFGSADKVQESLAKLEILEKNTQGGNTHQYQDMRAGAIVGAGSDYQLGVLVKADILHVLGAIFPLAALGKNMQDRIMPKNNFMRQVPPPQAPTVNKGPDPVPPPKYNPQTKT